MAEAQARVPGVEARAGKFPGPSLIPALNAIQERVGWLPREELVSLSHEVHRPLYEIEGLISFYPHFRTDPPKTVQLRVCHDLSCWLRGAETRIAALRERYGDDTETELIEGSCIGRCDIAPAGTVNEAPVRLDDADAAVEAAREATVQHGRNGHSNGHQTPPAPAASDITWPNDPYRAPGDRYAVLRAALARDLDTASIIAALKDAGLRGMGGAGFPTGRKWDLVAAQEATPKYVICNADESEPGTFKDREILATQPYLVLEGLLLGMLAVGAEEGWVFIRHEYGPEELLIRGEIDWLRETGLVGPDAGGSGQRLSVEVFTSPGGYILGEESALIECMEGHRGEPRNKPPFPGTYGLHGKPTLMNSVETFAHIPIIATRGAAWWNAQGAPSRTGVTHAGLEVLRRLGPCRVPRRLLRPDGHHRPRTPRPRGRRRRRQEARRHPAGRRVLQLHRPGHARRRAGLRHPAGGRLDARLGRDGGDGRGHRPARRRRQRAAVLPRRILRQMRAVPGRVGQGAHHPRRPA